MTFIFAFRQPFRGPDGVKSGDKIHLNLKAFSGHLLRYKSALFWQSGRFNAPISLCIEMDCFTGFAG